MKIDEIIFGRRGSSPLRVRPRKDGVTLIPVDPLSLGATDAARAVRETLAHARRDSAKSSVTQVQIALEGDATKLWVLDDAVRQIRAVKEHRGADTYAMEADTSSLADDIRLEVLLSRVAAALGASLSEDLGPALAHSGHRARGSAASPKELAFQRAHERARLLALEVRAIDAQMQAPRTPGWLWPAVASGALLVLAIFAAILEPETRRMVLPGLTLGFVAGLIGLGVWSMTRPGKSGLEAARTRKAQEREAARAEVRELSETLIKKGVDPGELLDRLLERAPPATTPAILARPTMSTADMTALGGLGRQVIVFLEPHGLLFAEDFGDAVRAFEGGRVTPPPPPPRGESVT